MKKNLLFLLINLLVAFMSSCGTNKVPDEEDKINDYIQDTFFGATFGERQEDVLTKLSDYPIFFKTKSMVLIKSEVVFEGITFPMMALEFENNQFITIEFSDAFDDNNSALSKYNEIKDYLTSKYKLTELPIDDESTLCEVAAVGRNNCAVIVGCYLVDQPFNLEPLKIVKLDFFDGRFLVATT